MADDADRLWLDEYEFTEGAVEPFAVYDFGVWGNASGGIKRGVRWNSTLEFGVIADTEALGWWPGGKFTLSAFWNHGNQASNPITGLSPFFAANPYIASNTIRAYRLQLAQEIIAGVLMVKFGQVTADDNFMLSNYATEFLNSSFVDLPTIASISAYPEYPLAAPGVYLEWDFAENWEYRTGLYTNDAGPTVRDNEGFDWRLGGDAGYAWFNEVEWDLALFGQSTAWTFGFFSQLSVTATEQRTGNQFTGENIYSLYFMWDQTLIADAEDPDDAELGAFWRISYTPDKTRYLVHPLYTDAGIAWYGPFPGRGDDVLGLAFNFATTTADYRAANPPARAQQWLIELTYKAKLYPGVTLQPDLQYVINPMEATSNHALALGLLLNVSL